MGDGIHTQLKVPPEASACSMNSVTAKNQPRKYACPTMDIVFKKVFGREQNKVCLYTGKTICLSDFIGSNPKFDIEHTIPRSRSLDNSQVNKTLCCATYNRQTEKDRIPFECDNYSDILLRIAHWYAKYKTLETQIKELSKKVFEILTVKLELFEKLLA